MRKVYVTVDAVFTANGQIVPRKILFEDGIHYKVDQVLDIRPRPSLKVGGIGMRYHIRIGSHRTFLFLEENRWFVEAKDAITTEE